MSEKIFEYRAAKSDGTWKRIGKRLSFFTEQTVPKLHEWLKRGDGASSYFCLENERPIPPLPANEPTTVALTAEQKAVIQAENKGCGCGKKRMSTSADVRTKLPTDACWTCAEKHLGSAYDTYAKEHGYRELNRMHYIGALNDAENHLASVVPNYAEKIRTFRHDIQNGRLKTDDDWQTLSKEFYDRKDSFFGNELLSKSYENIYIFSNVEASDTLTVGQNALLVFINKATNAAKYQEHEAKCVFHRSEKAEYGERRFDMPNLYVFGAKGIGTSAINSIKADYDWAYEIEEGKIKSCSTGYMVAMYLSSKFPGAKLNLVNFGFEVANSTYRCPWHNWTFEDEKLKQFNHIILQ